MTLAFQVLEIALPNLNDMDFRSQETTERSLVCGNGITPSYFPALMKMVIFHNTELTKTLIFILKVLWCSNNLMQKMTSITPSIY